MSSQSENRLLSPLQQRIAAASLVVLSLLVVAAFFLGLFLVLHWVVGFLSDILWPLAVSGILALLLRPLVLFIQHKLLNRRIAAIALIYALVLLFLLAMAGLLLPIMIQQAAEFIAYLPLLLERASAFLDQVFPERFEWIRNQLNLEFIREHLGRISRHFQGILEASIPALSSVGDFLTSTFTLLAGLFIIPVYLFFFLLTDRNPLNLVKNELSFVPEKIRDDLLFLAQEFASIIVAFFRGQVTIGLIMGVLMALGFTLAGLDFGAFLGIMVGVLNIIPYLGSIVGLLIIVPLSCIQEGGGLVLMLLVLLVFALVQMLEGYFLTPRIMGRTTGLHPLTIIISIFFWGKVLNGILGMVLAIPLTAFFVVAWRLLRKKYLDPGSPWEEPEKAAHYDQPAT
ncbi:MAG: AI-2E family transporter [Desulfohalobiaceae bacterium]